jgi:hypothetical protein
LICIRSISGLAGDHSRGTGRDLASIDREPGPVRGIDGDGHPQGLAMLVERGPECFQDRDPPVRRYPEK